MASASLTGRSILLIEDEPLIALDIQQALEREGAQVQTARSLASASQFVQGDTLSAAIVDFALSDGDAADICAILKRRGIPFILHSGYPSCCGDAAAIIPKPARPDDLVFALRDVLPVPKVQRHFFGSATQLRAYLNKKFSTKRPKQEFRRRSAGH